MNLDPDAQNSSGSSSPHSCASPTAAAAGQQQQEQWGQPQQYEALPVPAATQQQQQQHQQQYVAGSPLEAVAEESCTEPTPAAAAAGRDGGSSSSARRSEPASSDNQRQQPCRRHSQPLLRPASAVKNQGCHGLDAVASKTAELRVLLAEDNAINMKVGWLSTLAAYKSTHGVSYFVDVHCPSAVENQGCIVGTTAVTELWRYHVS